jgi:hypothetical protein
MDELQRELTRRLEVLEEALQRQDNAIIELKEQLRLAQVDNNTLEVSQLELKALLIRAADALDCFSATPYDLIEELRKAAE